MSFQQNSQPWFKNDPNKGMNDRVQQISRMRDPGTFADEILIGSRFLFILSLLFTGALCFFSYQFFLERFLSFQAATAAAIAVTVLIEYGKKRVGMSALRMPFMQGFRHIFSTPENTGVFAGASAFAIVIFAVSVYNSTNGAARYAETTANERTETTFTPDTRVIDEQIAATQRSIDNAPTATWKGTTYYQDKKSVRAASQSLASLTEQKSAIIAQQRADFERTRGMNDDANSHSAGIALRIGGWLELMQILLMFLMASCERVLDRRNPSGAPSPTQQRGGIGFQQTPRPATAQHGHNNDQTAQYTPIGFHRHYNNSGGSSVAQSAPPVPQQSSGSPYLSGQDADDALKYHLQRLQKEPSNLKRSDVNTDTVMLRINTVMDDMRRTLHGVDWCSEEVANRIETYWNATALPSINEAGYHYDASDIFGMLQMRARGGANSNV